MILDRGLRGRDVVCETSEGRIVVNILELQIRSRKLLDFTDKTFESIEGHNICFSY